MAVDNPNPETPNPQGETADPEGLDAATLAFGGQPEEPEQGNPAEPDPESEGEVDTEAEEADPQAAEPEESLAEVEFEGKTYKVAPELEKALLRQADYSRRMNEVSEKEKTYTQRLDALDGIDKIAEKRAESMAVVKQLDTQIEAYKGIDWGKAKAENPGQAALAAVELMTLQQQRSEALATAKEVAAEFGQERTKLIQQAKADMDAALKKNLKGWGDDLGQKLTTYADSLGVARKTLHELTDPAMVVALDKARRFDELQASKTALKAKGSAAPQVTKPGAPRVASPKADAMKAHRKDGSIDSAAAAFLALG